MPRLQIALLLLSACTDKWLPTPQTPARAIPEIAIDPGPQTEGQGRVAFDVVDGPTKVQEVLATESYTARSGGATASAYGERLRDICTTPCVVDMPRGQYQLRFSTIDGERHSEENVMIGAKPTVYRYATGKNKMPMGKIVASALLFSAGVFAGGGAIGGYATGNGGVGNALLLLGLGFEVGGFAVFQTARTWRQHGAAEQWTPDTGDVFTVR